MCLETERRVSRACNGEVDNMNVYDAPCYNAIEVVSMVPGGRLEVFDRYNNVDSGQGAIPEAVGIEISARNAESEIA